MTAEQEYKEREKTKVNELIDKAEELRRSQPARALEMALEAKTLAEVSGFESETAQALLQVGNSYWRLSQFQDALASLKESLAIFQHLNNYEKEAEVLGNLGLTYESLSEFDKALEYLQAALVLARSSGNQKLEARCLVNIGASYTSLGEYETALDYYLKSLVLAQELGEERTIGGVLGNIANIHFYLKDYRQTLKYQTDALECYRILEDMASEALMIVNLGVTYQYLGEFDIALEHVNESLILFRLVGNKTGEASALRNIGSVFEELNFIDKALEYHKKAADIALEIGDKGAYSLSLRSIGYLHREIGNFDIALEYLQRSIAIAQEIGLKQAGIEIHEQLYLVYQGLGNIEKALEHHVLFTNIREEVQSQEMKKATLALQLRFNVEKAEKEKEIFRLKNVELAQALAEVESLNQDLQELNNERSELLGIVAHDLKNPLASILISIGVLKRYTDRITANERDEHFVKIEATSKRMLDIISNLLNLNSIESGKMNISPEKCNIAEITESIVKNYADRARIKNIKLHFESDHQFVIGIADKSALEEVLDNLVSNVVKYSPHGKNAWVRVCSDLIDNQNNRVRVEIQDEGPGLTSEDKTKLFTKFARLSAQPTGKEDSTGLGLAIVKKLVEAMNGCILCESEFGFGAKFIVELPKA